MCKCLSVPLILLHIALAARADNWPAWRGPTGDGQATAKNLPLTWSATDNVRWKAPLPAPGSSTPIVWGDRVFLTQATDKGKLRGVLCFARADGRLLWRRDTEYAWKETTHSESNPYCSASPVTDGERVIASLGSAGLVCYDFAGKLVWRRDVGKLDHMWGNASSPVLCGNLVIVWCGPGPRQFLLALDKRTGEKVWQHDEPRRVPDDSDEPDDWIGSWATPIIVHAKGRDELVQPLPGAVKGFDPKTGKELWHCTGIGACVYPSPVAAGDVVVVFSGCGGAVVAVKAGGSGDVTETRRVWRNRFKNPQRVGSPVIVGNRVYTLAEPGFAQSFEMETGTEFWGQRRGVAGRALGSLVHADGRLYATTEGGVTLVLAVGPRFEVLAKNDIGERVLASPVVVDDTIFLRSDKHLWCISAKK
jgi:outer membrane protein assembly factor BamB